MNPTENTRKTATMKRHPQILHIGFSKCASTYLRALFRAHPKVHLVFKSGFFTPFLAKEMTFADYQSLFSDDVDMVNVESDEHLTLPCIHPELGVRATNLAQFERVTDKIKEFLPDVKIIMVIRNQASLMVSRYSEFLILGGNLNFEEFVSKLMGEDRGENLYYQNYYFEVIKILEKRFLSENLLILMQEEMRDDTGRTAATIREFLSLDEGLALRRSLRNERKSLSFDGMRLLYFLNKRLVRTPSVGGAPPTTRVPLFVFQNVVRVVRAIDFYVLSRFLSGSSKVLTTTRRNAILAKFRRDNLRLQEYFDRDLSGFGYLLKDETV